MKYTWKRIPRMMCTLWNSFIAFSWWNISKLPRGNVTSNERKKAMLLTNTAL